MENEEALNETKTQLSTCDSQKSVVNTAKACVDENKVLEADVERENKTKKRSLFKEEIKRISRDSKLAYY